MQQHEQTLHRCFYAVKFDAEVTRYVIDLMETLRRHRADVAWTPTTNVHLTLRFLGDLDDRTFEGAQTLPDQEDLGRGFIARVEGLGAFPLLRAPRILWTGVSTPASHDMDRLRHLQQRTEIWAQRIGLPKEGRRFTPHVTLGRVRPPFKHVKELIDDMIARECRSRLCSIDELLLMRSTLERSGPTYEVVKKWKLSPASEARRDKPGEDYDLPGDGSRGDH